MSLCLLETSFLPAEKVRNLLLGINVCSLLSQEIQLSVNFHIPDFKICLQFANIWLTTYTSFCIWPAFTTNWL